MINIFLLKGRTRPVDASSEENHYGKQWDIQVSLSTNLSELTRGWAQYSSCLMINIKHVGRPGPANQVKTDIPPLQTSGQMSFCQRFHIRISVCGSSLWEAHSYPVTMCINTGNSGKGFYFYQKYCIEWFIILSHLSLLLLYFHWLLLRRRV